MAGRAFADGDYAASRIRGGDASVATDFRLHPLPATGGAVRYLVFDASSGPYVRGRMVQKLLEIETYRMASLLALPMARDLQPRIGEIEQRVTDLVAVLEGDGEPDDRALLSELSRLAGEVEAMNARSAYRFAASRAYDRIIDERLERLRESRIEGRERLRVFLERRLKPAIRTCEATAERQQALAQRIDRAISLLATRVEVSVEEQNARLLSSMDERAKLQLRLQETVEGLSAVAITYYGVGLINYVTKGLKEAHAPIPDPALIAAFAAPVIFGMVWLGIRAVRRRLRRDTGAKA